MARECFLLVLTLAPAVLALPQNASPSLTIALPTASASAIVAAAHLNPYISPSASRTITEWLAIGDSYSAGLGADSPDDHYPQSQMCFRFSKSMPVQMQQSSRMPGDPSTRIFTFGSCIGATTENVMEGQLRLGDPNGKEKYTSIGKPQLATLSAGGNDIDFMSIINNCILNYVNMDATCRQTLDKAWGILNDPAGNFYLDLVRLYVQTIARGRIAGGVTPPENFQLFVTDYVTFWNEDDDGCDTVYWTPPGREKFYLTKALRKEMNDMTHALNSLISSAVNATASLGVTLVNNWHDSFNGHRYCEPGSDLWDPSSNPDIWFWSRNANSTNGEDIVNIARGFHPRSTGYAKIADATIDAILASTNGTAKRSLSAEVSQDRMPHYLLKRLAAPRLAGS